MPRILKDVMPEQKRDRRLLSHVPDPSRVRSCLDRRKTPDRKAPQPARFAGQRYNVSFPVTITVRGRRRLKLRSKSLDVSQTGLLVRLSAKDAGRRCTVGSRVTLRFQLKPGMLHEGMEKHYRVKGKIVRVQDDQLAFTFDEPLYRYLRRTKNGYLMSIASLFLFFCVLFILLMRVESVMFFSSNTVLYLYSLIAAAYLLTRYWFGAMYRPVPVDEGFTPSVTVVIPCFNEETWIRRTILSCVDQDYPPDKLQIIIVDDGSSDNSVAVIQDVVSRLWQEDRFANTKSRIRVFLQRRNQGKREAMALGIHNTTTDLVAFVDSDSFLEPDAIRCLVQPFVDPKVGGVTGRTDVANAYTNGLTKMQCVRYYISFRILKAAEAYFDSVMCLSGPLSAYRTDAVRDVLDAWVNQTFLGQRATFGDDRSLTNYIVEHYRTDYQDTAICSTIVPNRHKVFLRQQMRWKRSWLRESLRAARFMWRKEPLMVFSFYFGLLIPLAAPLIVLFNLVYVPIVQHVFPTTFLLGLLMMSLLMSFAQLLLRKSRLWIYGLWFCLYYECVLLWQMPWAWVTFWVSNWGTRGVVKKKAVAS